ncbi:hypothetical protein EXIGLDRAFT_702173 [Exidia glandulosa HHB12029]|uniref:Uncharacterized protein n=1 Tax=Exidia glandulosa HHB12029 TaxID=1314781 RepID=A0A165CPG4_EXIGL|nr:hypothetical protein EXIGLDRAFT_702173 [Exidia glandulosa HHB12029]
MRVTVCVQVRIAACADERRNSDHRYEDRAWCRADGEEQMLEKVGQNTILGQSPEKYAESLLTRRLRYPWLSPNLRKSYKALHEYLQMRTNDILTEVLVNIYETREMAQAYLERQKKKEKEEARTNVIT